MDTLDLVRLFDERFGHLFYDEEDVWEWELLQSRRQRAAEIAAGAEPTLMECIMFQAEKRLVETSVMRNLVVEKNTARG